MSRTTTTTPPVADGGPAFPQMLPGGDDGMKLRDWLAAHASEEDVQEMMYGDKDYRNLRRSEYTRQQARYRHADAMLAARKGTIP